jgi:hypothetical protein
MTRPYTPKLPRQQYLLDAVFWLASFYEFKYKLVLKRFMAIADDKQVFDNWYLK